MFNLNSAYSFLKDAKKNNFDDWFKLSYQQQKLFLETIIKDEKTMEFLNNTHKYIRNYSKSMQFVYIKRKLMLIGLTSKIGYFTYQKIDIKYLNELLTTINFILKKVNTLQPLPS